MSYGYKVVLVGDTDVGKSSFFVRFKDGKFVENLSGTIGLDQTTQNVTILEKHCINNIQNTRIQLWDTAGLEKAGRLTNNHYRGARAAILMYDVTELSTFYSLSSWLSEATTYTKESNEPCLFFLIGNKIDCTVGEIEVTEDTVKAFAKEKAFDERYIFQVSVKTGKGFDELLSFVGSCLSGYKPPPPKPDKDTFGKYEEKKCAC